MGWRERVRKTVRGGLATLALYGASQFVFREIDAIRDAMPSPVRDELETALGVRVTGDLPDTSSDTYKYLRFQAPKMLARARAIGPLDFDALYLTNRPLLTADPLEQWHRIYGASGFYNPGTRTLSLYLATGGSFTHEAAHALSFFPVLSNEELQDSFYLVLRDDNGEPLYPRALIPQLFRYFTHIPRKIIGDTISEANAVRLGLPEAYAATNSFELAADLIEHAISDTLYNIKWIDGTSEDQGPRLIKALTAAHLMDPGMLPAHALLSRRRVSLKGQGEYYVDGEGFQRAANAFLRHFPKSLYAADVRAERDRNARLQAIVLASHAQPDTVSVAGTDLHSIFQMAAPAPSARNIGLDLIEYLRVKEK